MLQYNRNITRRRSTSEHRMFSPPDLRSHIIHAFRNHYTSTESHCRNIHEPSELPQLCYPCYPHPPAKAGRINKAVFSKHVRPGVRHEK
jgi:hypothetical protein